MPRDPLIEMQDVLSRMTALDSRMRVVAQRMKIIEGNEQIIGKTLISHNKKLKEIEETAAVGITGAGVGAELPDVTEIKTLAGDVKKTCEELRSVVDDVRSEVLRHKEDIDRMREELNEIRYVLDTINPVAYVTVDQVSDLIEEILEKRSRKSSAK